MRNAFPGFSGLLRRGPFSEEEFQRLPQTRWTLLVQGVNLFLREGAQLLSRFNFIPRARLDDLMVGYALKGDGVGPHFDPYGVFLIQGIGHHRRQISTRGDQTLPPGAPLRILQNFQPEQKWITGPGDLPTCHRNAPTTDWHRIIA